MRKRAQICLFLSMLCFLSFLGSRLILGEWFPFMGLILAVAGVSFLASLALDIGFLRSFLKASFLKSFLQMSLRFGMATLVYVLLVFLSGEWNFSVDLSKNQVNSLSTETKKHLQQLSSKVEIYGFFQEKDAVLQRDSFFKLCSLFELESSQLECLILNPVERPDLVDRLKVNHSPSVFLSAQGRNLALESWSEEKLVNAILRLQYNIKTKLCLTEGHGEIPWQAKEDYSVSSLMEDLEQMGVEVSSLNAAEYEKNLPSCDAVGIFGPVHEFSKQEQEKLASYLQSGKSLFLAIEPGKKHQWNFFLRKYGVRFLNDYVIDTDAEKWGLNAANVIGNYWNLESKFARAMKNTQVVFPVASRFLLDEDERTDWKLTEVLWSGEASFTKAELKEKMEFQPGKDFEGRMLLGVLLESFKNSAKMLVTSDADFLSNRFLSYQNNRQFATRSLEYLLRKEGDLSIASKSFYREIFILTPVKAKSFLLVFVMPFGFVFLSMALWVWFKRRQTG